MIQISPQTTWLICAPIAAMALIFASSALWGRFRPKSSPPDPARQMLDELLAANAKLAAVVSAERAVVAAIDALPDDVPPLEARNLLRQLTPGYAIQDRYILIRHAWETQRSPQALSALAGMALADANGTHAEAVMVLHLALEKGGPVLVGQIAAQLATRQEELARFLRTGGALLQLESAARRFMASDPVIAGGIEDAITRITPRMRAQMLKTLRWYINHWTEEEQMAPEQLAEALVPYCLPRFPELAAAVHTAFARHDGPEWERAALRFDRTLIDHFAGRGGLEGFNVVAANTRLCEAIMSLDASLSEHAACDAARLVGDNFYEEAQFRLALQAAVDWAEGMHGPLPPYQWLANALQSPEARTAEAEADFVSSRKVNAAVKTLADTTATLEPEIALIELRVLLPVAPVDRLRVSLSARWQEDRAVVCLSALCGLVLELTAGEPPREGLVGLCVRLPLREGPALLIESLLALLSARFGNLDGWIETEGSVRELKLAVRRFEAAAPGTAAALSRLLNCVYQRRLTLLKAQIEEKLARAASEEETMGSFELVLGPYRLYLPGEASLTLPVRRYIRARSDRLDWRRAGLYLESMALIHFDELGESADYDVDYLIQVLSEGLKDDEVEVAWLAATLATKLVEKDLLKQSEHFDDLIASMQWADNLHDPVPESFVTLRHVIAQSLMRGRQLDGASAYPSH